MLKPTLITLVFKYRLNNSIQFVYIARSDIIVIVMRPSPYGVALSVAYLPSVGPSICPSVHVQYVSCLRFSRNRKAVESYNLVET